MEGKPWPGSCWYDHDPTAADIREEDRRGDEQGDDTESKSQPRRDPTDRSGILGCPFKMLQEEQELEALLGMTKVALDRVYSKERGEHDKVVGWTTSREAIRFAWDAYKLDSSEERLRAIEWITLAADAQTEGLTFIPSSMDAELRWARNQAKKRAEAYAEKQRLKEAARAAANAERTERSERGGGGEEQ